jgi:5'-methylthioadenosine phosphorylase
VRVNSQDAAAEIGVFGGSGFYSFLDDVSEVLVQTPFGPPSTKIHLGDIGGRRVAFLARHGPEHQIPAHRVNYKANVWALRRLGVTRVLGPCAVGSLQPHVRPSEFVVCDQLVDRTWGRADTYFDGPLLNSITFADPYCPELRSVAIEGARSEGITVHPQGTVVVIQGPRFSTRAESGWFRSAGWEVVNMTQYPEAVLSRELGMCYANISLVTDYDSGLEGYEGIEPVSMEIVLKVLDDNLDRLRALLMRAIPAIPADRNCPCGAAALDPGALPS